MACQNSLGGCFVAGTSVHTQGGPVPIEQIRAGDLVLSRLNGDGEPTYKRVTHASVRENQIVIRVTFGSDDDRYVEYSVFVTVDHPFWVEGIGWTTANRLRPAASLRRADGSSAEVIWVRPLFRTDRPNVALAIVDAGEEGVGREIDFADDFNYLEYVDVDESLLDGTLEDPYFRTRVYKIEVEEFNTFHVGKLGVLVQGAHSK